MSELKLIRIKWTKSETRFLVYWTLENAITPSKRFTRCQWIEERNTPNWNSLIKSLISISIIDVNVQCCLNVRHGYNLFFYCFSSFLDVSTVSIATVSSCLHFFPRSERLKCEYVMFTEIRILCPDYCGDNYDKHCN